MNCKLLITIIVILFTCATIKAQVNKTNTIRISRDTLENNIIHFYLSNLSDKIIYISTDTAFGTSGNTILKHIDCSYSYMTHCWLSMPKLKLRYSILNPNTSILIYKYKDLNGLQKIYFSFDAIEFDEDLPKRVKQRLKKGFIYSKDMYLKKMEYKIKHLHVELKL